MLDRSFFARSPIVVAQDLLGTVFIHETELGRIAGIIIETEAYNGETDMASHARFGNTPRTAVMFDEPGHLYVYLIYGIFNMTNIVAHEKGRAGAVLIRAIEMTEGEELAKLNLAQSKFVKPIVPLATGPGKLSTAFGIDRTHNGADLIGNNTFGIVPGTIDPAQIIATTRVGIDYAGPDKDQPWRFYTEGNKYVSKL